MRFRARAGTACAHGNCRRNPAPEEAAGLTFLDRMKMIDAIEHQVREIKEVGGTMSTVTFSRSLDAGQGGLFEQHVQAGINKVLLRHRDKFLHGDYLRERLDPATGKVEELWRISAVCKRA